MRAYSRSPFPWDLHIHWDRDTIDDAEPHVGQWDHRLSSSDPNGDTGGQGDDHRHVSRANVLPCADCTFALRTADRSDWLEGESQVEWPLHSDFTTPESIQ